MFMKLENLNVIESDNEFYNCVVALPWYGKTTNVYVRFENDDDAQPTQKQLQAFKELLNEAPQIFEKLEEQLFAYYQEQREDNKYEDYYEEFFSELKSPKDLEKHIYFHSIKVSYYDEDWSKFIGLIMDCDWDKQLGVGVMLIKNKVREINVQDIVL